MWHLSEPQFPHLPRGNLTGADLNPPESKRLCQRISTSRLPRVAGALESSPGSEIFTGWVSRKSEIGEWELDSPAAYPLEAARCFLPRRPPQEVVLGSWEPRTGEGAGEGLSLLPKPAGDPGLPFPPSPKNPVALCPPAKATFLGVFREPPSHQQTKPPPPSQASRTERGSWASLRGGRGARPAAQKPGVPGAAVWRRLPGTGSLRSAGRTGGGGSSNRSSGNRSERLRPAGRNR